MAVATGAATVGDEAYGAVTQRASILDIDPAGGYALVAAYELTPGSNYRAGLARRSPWGRRPDRKQRSGRRPLFGDQSVDEAVSVASVGRRAPTGNSRSSRFATVATLDEPPGSGDGSLDATVGGRFTKGFHASERDVASTRLVLPAADA